MVGENEGTLLGDSVGDALTVGAASVVGDPAIVGERVGLNDGATEGASVGVMVHPVMVHDGGMAGSS